MKRRTGFTLIELLVVIAIIAILAAILFPVFASVRKKAFAANCQSNMKQIGSSIKMYLSDYDDTFPTNRGPIVSGYPAGPMTYDVQLSNLPVGPDEPKRFEFGINWVEGLYSYIERVAGAEDASSVWRCQASSNARYPTKATNASKYNTASVNYAFNGYLCEQPEGVVKVASNTMMVRELDRVMNAQLRPFNQTMCTQGPNNGIRPAAGSNTDRPIDAFLSINDMMGGLPTVNKQHGKGSHLLFADGHVKFYTNDYMPAFTEIVTAKSWDQETVQWYNFKKDPAKPSIKERTIGITP